MKKRYNELSIFDEITISDTTSFMNHTLLPIHNSNIKKNNNLENSKKNHCCSSDMIFFGIACGFIIFIFLFPIWIILTSASIYMTDSKINQDITYCINDNFNCGSIITTNCSDYLNVYKYYKSEDISEEKINYSLNNLKMCYLKNGNILWTSLFDTIIVFIISFISISILIMLFFIFRYVGGFKLFKIINRHKENI